MHMDADALIWSLVCRKPTENRLAPRNTGVIPQNGGKDFLGQRYTPNPLDNFGAYLVFRHITTRHPSCLLLPLLPPLLPPLGSPRRPTNQCGDPTVRRPPAGRGSIPHLPKQNARSGQYVFGNWLIFGSSVFFASEWGSHLCGYGGVVFSCEHTQSTPYWKDSIKLLKFDSLLKWRFYWNISITLLEFISIILLVYFNKDLIEIHINFNKALIEIHIYFNKLA